MYQKYKQSADDDGDIELSVKNKAQAKAKIAELKQTL